MKYVEVNSLLIKDITMSVAKKDGMIQPNEEATKTARAIFFIDAKGVICFMIYFLLNLGRNFDELYRVTVALQTTDEFGVATPADWFPGNDVIIEVASS